MKLTILFTIFLVVFVAAITAQQSTPLLLCPQGATPPTCIGAPNAGNNCTTAQPRIIWYFDQGTRFCRPLNHLGCGGNSNRWCSLLQCILSCVLLTG